MHQKLISLEGNTIFQKVKRLYKCLCICRARNLQRSWDLSLVNVKGLMVSAYCRKLEKYSCTQMSLRSGYELHLCHNLIFLYPSISFPTTFSPHQRQKHKPPKQLPPSAHYLWEHPNLCFPLLSKDVILLFLSSKFSNYTLSPTPHTKLSKEFQGMLINIFR